MSKFKIEHNGAQNFLVISGQKGQQISEREYYAISRGQIPGLLRAELVRKGNSFKLVYNVSGYISLREFLLNPLNKQSFERLLSNILTNLKALQNAYYNYQFILMDLNAAMVNPTTHKVSFVYVPITYYESGTSLKEFLLSIIQCCTFVKGEDVSYVRDYIRILNHGINFSVFDLEEYIKGLQNNGGRDDSAKKCTRCGSLIAPNVNFCSSCGMKLTGLRRDDARGVYDPAQNAPKAAASQPSQSVAGRNDAHSYSSTISPNNLGYQQNQFMNAQAAQQQSAYQQPQAAQQSAYQQPQVVASEPSVAYLFRLKTGEQTRVSAQLFRIGKDPHNCEYCIRDNPAISRCHASIKYVNNRWYITDLNSTNKTYVNDSPLTPNVDVELISGTSIKLANEDFIFNIFN